MHFFNLMKVLNIVGIFFVGILGISCGTKQVKVEKEVTINAPLELVYNQVNDVRNAHVWSLWGDKKSGLLKHYSTQFTGVGASVRWEDKETGDGAMKIVNDSIFNQVQWKIELKELDHDIDAKFQLKLEGSNVKLTSVVEQEQSTFNSMFHDKSDIYDKGLEKALYDLKYACEQKLIESKILKVQLKPTNYVTIREEFDPLKETNVSNRLLGEMVMHLRANGQEPKGAPIAIYYARSNGEKSQVDLEMGIPATEKVDSTERIKYKEMGARNALMYRHFGGYTSLEKSYKKVTDFMNENNIAAIGAPWEEYVTNPGQQPDSSKWETRIYFPLE